MAEPSTIPGFTTGEFSRLARVSKRLLQFYDEQDVLRPAHVDPRTGYRRYAAAQLAALNRVLALKAAGLSLAEVRALLARGVSADDVRVRLRAKRAAVEADARAAVQRLRALEARLAADDADGPVPDVVVKALPARRLLARRVHLASSAEAWPWVRATAAALREALGSARPAARAGWEFSVSLLGDGFEVDDVTLEAGLAFPDQADGGPVGDAPAGFTWSALPARPRVATVVQAGGPDLLPVGCAAVARHVEAHGYQLLGPPREAFVALPHPLALPAACEDAVVEAQFAVA